VTPCFGQKVVKVTSDRMVWREVMKEVSSGCVFRKRVEKSCDENYITSSNHMVTITFFIASFPNDGTKTFLSPFLLITVNTVSSVLSYLAETCSSPLFMTM
jgi:hypothetical protein